jgi:hypothetical protein
MVILYLVTYSLSNQVMFAIVFQKAKKSHENNAAFQNHFCNLIGFLRTKTTPILISQAS